MRAPGQHHALVIDDQAAVRDEVQEHLANLGHTCAMASSREEAMQQMDGAHFDYVVLDLEIPTRFGRPSLLATGHALLDALRAAHPDLPIIVISAKDDERHRLGMEVLRLNRATDFIPKPFPDPGQGRTLMQAIQEALGVRRRRDTGRTDDARVPRPGHGGVFSGGDLIYYPNRVTLCSYWVAGAERQSIMRCILDCLRVVGPGGERIRCTGPHLANTIPLQATEATITGVIRDFRGAVSEMIREELGLHCPRHGVIESGTRGQVGYRLARHLHILVSPTPWCPVDPAASPAGASNHDVSTGYLTGQDDRNAPSNKARASAPSSNP